MSTAPESNEPKPYAMVSHESAVEAIWALAARHWTGVLDDEDAWMVPDTPWCVHTQGDFKRLQKCVDLGSLGICRRPIDLLVPNKSCYSRGKLARFHVWADFFPPHSFVRVHDLVLISTPYFSALQLAMALRPTRATLDKAQEDAHENERICHDLGIDASNMGAKDFAQWDNIGRFVRAAQVLCDFCGTYRYVPEGSKAKPSDPDVVYRTKPIVTTAKMQSYLGEMSSSRGIMRARRVLAASFDGAASPMETMLALVLTLPTKMGGFELPRPKLNYKISPSASLRELSSKDKMYADLCWPEKKLIVEYYGWEDHFGAGRVKVGEDAARANSLTALGWTVLHVTYEQVRTLAGLSLLARQVARGIGSSLPEVTDLELVWRVRLLAMLLPSCDLGR